MKHLSKILVLLFIAVLGVSSCGDEPDGKWDKMKWTNVNNLMNIQGVYYLPEESGEYTFLCRNYEHPWIESVSIDGKSQTLDPENRLQFSADWFTVKFEGNKLTVTATALPDAIESRGFILQVTAGDIFDTFYFTQEQDIYQ